MTRESLCQQIACRMRAMAESLLALETCRDTDERLLLLGWVQESADRVEALIDACESPADASVPE